MNMTKDKIYQFVGFVSNINSEKFTTEWERYASKLSTKKNAPVLMELVGGKKNKYSHLSKHEWESTDERFAFMEERKSEFFADMPVRVVQTGGYIGIHQEKKKQPQNDMGKLVVFVSHDENDIAFYKDLPLYLCLNIYQAFYESCLFGYVMEFFVSQNDTAELLQLLKQRTGADAGQYKKCLMLHS
jgi:hypothetical protein